MLSPDLAPNPAGPFIPPWPTHPGKGLGFLFKAAAALGQTLHRPGAEGIAFGWRLDPVLLCKLLLAGGAMLGTRVPHAAANVKLREDDGLSLLLHCGWIPCSKGAPWDTPQPPAWGCSTHPLHPSPPSSEGTASSGAGCCCQDFTPSALGRDLTKLRGGGGGLGVSLPIPAFACSPAADGCPLPGGIQVPVVLPEGQIQGTLDHVGARWSPPRLSLPGLCPD